jgi:hypothetical protein
MMKVGEYVQKEKYQQELIKNRGLIEDLKWVYVMM